MKFEKAYCEELNDCINPYEARDLYFSNDSNYYMRKLSFHCPSEHCRVPLLPVAIYRKEKTKTKIHFRTKSLNNHIISPKKCDFYYDIDQDFTNEVNAKKSNHKKKSVLPSEFLLVKPTQLKKTLRKVEDTMNIYNNVNRVTRSKSTGSIKKGSSNVKTPYFEQIIDCYENNDPNTLKTETLTINGKKKSYSSFFKKCEYFLDEEGLIYWGEVTKLKKYGNNYRVKFKKKVRVNEKGLEITIYLNSDLIQSYNKKNQLLEVLDKLTTFNGEIRCYFVGVYPVFEKVSGKGNEFEVISVKIENLDHLVFRFDFEVEE